MKSEENKEIDEELNTRGLYCPEPLFEVRNLYETLGDGQLETDDRVDPAADEDLHRWAKRTGTEILVFRKEDNDLIFIFKKPIK